MNGKTHAYLDLVASPAVGAMQLDQRPAWVFRSDGAAILWANAAGARFFGDNSMTALLERPIPGSNPIVKQLNALADILPTETPRMEILRFALDFTISALPTACWRIDLVDGSNAVLVVAMTDAANESIISRAEDLTDLIASDDSLVAIIADDGRIIGASGEFQSFSPASLAIDTLAEAILLSEDRIVKQTIQIAGMIRPSGIVRFQNGGEPMSLLIVGPAEAQGAKILSNTDEAIEAFVTAGQATPPSSAETTPAVRFLWQLDADQRFTFVSDELCRVVGDENSNLVGASWRDAAERLLIDEDGLVQSALDDRKQWSGVKIFWPVDGGDLRIAAELSAVPIIEHGETVGHRGIGILSPDDNRLDEQPANNWALPPLTTETAEPVEAEAADPATLEAEARETAPFEVDAADTDAFESEAAGLETPEPEAPDFELPEAEAEDTEPSEAVATDPELPEVEAEDAEPPEAAAVEQEGSETETGDSEPPEAEAEITEAPEATDSKWTLPQAEAEDSKPPEAEDLDAQPPEAIVVAQEPSETELDDPETPQAEGRVWLFETNRNPPDRMDVDQDTPPAETEGPPEPPEAEDLDSQPPESIMVGQEPSEADEDAPEPPQTEGRVWLFETNRESRDRDDVDDAARKIVEQDSEITTDGDSPSADTPTGEATDLPSDPVEPSNVVPLPEAPPATIPLEPDHLSGIEQDAFHRIADALETQGVEQSETTTDENLADAFSVAGGEAAISSDPDTLLTQPDTAILDRLPIGIIVFRGDDTLYANQMLFDLLGYASLADFVAAGGRDAFFADGDPDWDKSETGLRESRLTVRRKDGEYRPIEAKLQSVAWAGATALMMSISEQPIQPEHAAPPEILLEDIASAEAKLDELEAILDTATDGVIVIGGDGRIGNINQSAEALFGVEASDVLGTPFSDLFAEESQKAALDYLDGLAANGVASILNDGREVIGNVPQGGLIPLFMTMGRLGGTGKFCAVLRDITHWKNAEEELVAARRAAEDANAQKSDFLAKISHEIRTPLNAIIGFSEVMMEERFGPLNNTRYRDYLRDIHVSGSHLMSLINDLLDLSKIEAGKLELSFESVATNEAIQECVALMQPQANRERIIIRTSLSSDVTNIVADPRSLRQILLNLLSNAIKFTQAGGQVIVSTGLEEKGEVIIRIRDTGIGMSQKDIETALKPFRQLTTSGKARGEGTGLGLPLTKALVEANRAVFAIDSTVDQGTLVKITIPTTRVLAG
jgi:PAS domain S-box-containing protein